MCDGSGPLQDPQGEMDSLDFASKLVELARRVKEQKAALREAEAELQKMKSKMLDIMVEKGSPSLRVDGATIYMSQGISAKLAIPDRSEAVRAVKAWEPSLVRENFDLRNIGGFVREALKGGEYEDVDEYTATLPQAIQNAFKISDWYDVRIRKA